MELSISDKEAGALWQCATRSFIDEQPQRFETITDDQDPLAETYAEGTMYWCATAADAVLFLSFERQAHSAMLLWDLDSATSEDDVGSYVVLSSRAFDDH